MVQCCCFCFFLLLCYFSFYLFRFVFRQSSISGGFVAYFDFLLLLRCSDQLAAGSVVRYPLTTLILLPLTYPRVCVYVYVCFMFPPFALLPAKVCSLFSTIFVLLTVHHSLIFQSYPLMCVCVCVCSGGVFCCSCCLW